MNTLYVVDISAFHGDNETCLTSPLGMETGLIRNGQIGAKNYYNRTTFPRYARLAGPNAWCPAELPSYLQVDLIVLHYICAFATQGFYEQGFFTKKYSISLKAGDKSNFYQDANGNPVSYLMYSKEPRTTVKCRK